MVEGLVWAIWLHLLQSTEQLTTAYWMDCLPGSCGVHAPQLGLSSKLGYESMSQSALAALIVIADMTCPMNVEFYYVSSQRITRILGFDRHPRMAALRPPLKRGCQEVVPQNNGTAAYAALYEGTRFDWSGPVFFCICICTGMSRGSSRG